MSLPIFLLGCVFLLLPLAHERLFPTIPLYLAEIPLLLAGLLFLWSGSHGARIRTLVRQEQPLLWSQGMLVAGASLALLSSGHFFTGIGLLKSFIILPLLFMILVALSVHSKNERQLILLYWWGGLVAAASASLFLFAEGVLTYDGRLASFYASPNYLAMLLSPGVLISWWLLGNRWSRGRRMILVLGTTTLVVALALTRSYAVIPTTFFLSLWLLFSRSQRLSNNWRKYTFIPIGILFLSWWGLIEGSTEKFHALFDFAGRSSTASRLMIWVAAVKISQDTFPLGIGLGQFQSAYLAYQSYFPPYLEWAVPEPHNLMLSIFLSTGLMGLLGFVWGVVIIVKKLVPFLHSTDEEEQKTAKLLLSFFGWFLLIGLVDTPFFRNDLAFVWWGVLGLTVAFARSQEARD